MAKGDQPAQQMPGITGNAIKSGLNLSAPNFNSVGTLGSSIVPNNAGLNPNAGFGNTPLMPPMMPQVPSGALIAALGGPPPQRSFVGPYNNMPMVNGPAAIPQPNIMKPPAPNPNTPPVDTNAIGPSEDMLKKLMGHNYSFNV